MPCRLTASVLLGLFALNVPAADVVLPVGSNPKPVEFPWFPSRLHAVVWRNWDSVPAGRIAATVGATPEQVEAIAASMGLPENRPVAAKYDSHHYKTVLRRNWHLLPYEQLLTLLDMPAEELAFLLHEDDFLYIKLGSLKPNCEPVRYAEPDEAAKRRAAAIADVVKRRFGDALNEPGEPRYAFIEDLSKPSPALPSPSLPPSAPRYLYSYFAVFGDPLLDPALDPYPDGLLAQLAASGVEGVWMHVVLRQLAPGGESFPEWGEGHETRLANLAKLVERAKRHGLKIYLYMNEPRAMPHGFFDSRPDLAGVKEGERTALCTSGPRTRAWLRDSLTHVFRTVPDLGGVFTITASENLTNCASHGHADQCPRCKGRSEAAIIGEVNAAIEEGVHAGSPSAKVITYDWGWNRHGDAAEHLALSPKETWLLSVSEWSQPFERGGVKGAVGEYSMSVVGPGPRATRHWALAKARGLKTVAKVQVNSTWELSSVPYLPVLDLVAEHMRKLAAADVDGLMLSWSLGGSPSPNLDVACRIVGDKTADPQAVLDAVARERYGAAAAPHVRKAWTAFSDAFREFPYDGRVLYVAPQQFGPANPLFPEPTGYAATMIGFPYDHFDGWRGPYPRETFVGQMEKVAKGWEAGLAEMERAVAASDGSHRGAVEADLGLARAAHLHFASTADQARFVMARERVLVDAGDVEAWTEIRGVIDREIESARRLYDLTKADSRIGFEASNGYYYTPLDLVEKVVCCESLRGWFEASGK